MSKLTPKQRRELEKIGWELSEAIERDDYEPGTFYAIDELPPDLALFDAKLQYTLAIREADRKLAESVKKVRDEGYSWHKIGVRLGMTAEGARKRFAHV